MQSAGIGDGAGMPAVIDHGHVMALLGQEPGEAHADDAAAHDHRADFGRRAPLIRHDALVMARASPGARDR